MQEGQALTGGGSHRPAARAAVHEEQVQRIISLLEARDECLDLDVFNRRVAELILNGTGIAAQVDSFEALVRDQQAKGAAEEAERLARLDAEAAEVEQQRSRLLREEVPEPSWFPPVGTLLTDDLHRLLVVQDSEPPLELRQWPRQWQPWTPLRNHGPLSFWPVRRILFDAEGKKWISLGREKEVLPISHHLY